MLRVCYAFSMVMLVSIANSMAQERLLPAESELPRQHVHRDVELPGESELPASHAPSTSPTAEQQPRVVEPKAIQLPLEGQLPPGAEEAQIDPAGALPLEGSPDGIPWLRLNLRGHTAPLRASAFLPSGKRLCTAGDDKSVVVWSRVAEGLAPWRYERTIRWQVQRGTRGRIPSPP